MGELKVDDIRHLTCENVPTPLPIYSHATVHNGVVYVSCLQGFMPGTMEFRSPAASDQARQIFDNMQAVLHEAGSDLSRVLKLTILMTDMNDFGEINDVVNEYFPRNAPARGSIAAAELPKGAKVVVDAIAATTSDAYVG
jgi:2-iminobutanoate/2-iminopropanoate deaminase